MNLRMFGTTMLVLAILMASDAPGQQNAKPTPAATPYEIQLRSRSFTPEPGIPPDLGDRVAKVVKQVDDSAVRATRRAHVLVQVEQPLESADRERFSEAGVNLLEPVGKRVWYASVSPQSVEALARLKGVRWADVVRPQDKLDRDLQQDRKPFAYELRPDGRIAYSVLFHKDVSAEEVMALARRVEGKLEEFDAKSFSFVRSVIISVQRDQLNALAEADIVSWIEPSYPPDEDHNVLSAQPLSNVDDVQGAPYDLDGSNVTVGIWEANDVVYAAHLDLQPRVTVEEVDSVDDHAAHVAGTIGASGVNVPNAEGMAPQVDIASWEAAGDAGEMANAATSAGNPGQPTPIQISNHSYGSNIGWNGGGTFFNTNQNLFGVYNNLAVGFDNVVAQTGLIVVKSAGNDRDDAWDGATPQPGVPPNPIPPGDGLQGGLGVFADCIGPRGSAKNVITVGAMNGAGAIADFSGFGPTDDGRIKPDLMAQGVRMLSLASNAFDDRDGDGIDDAPNTTTSSRLMGGTSMATPVVSGVAALLLQQGNSLSLTNLTTNAAVKAVLIQTAEDVQGIGQANPGPDYATGWGIADARAAVNLLRQLGFAQGSLSGTGAANAWSETFFVPAGQAEIHLTLAWDDPAGAPAAAQALVNDLDLRLIDPSGTTWNPWTLNAGNPGQAAVRNGGNDAVNNVEQVSVLNPIAGTWTAQVSAGAGNLPQSPQGFTVAGLLQRSDIALVMDRSGSMSLPSGTPGVTKLQALQSAANEFVDLLDLGGGHRVGLVQFEENVVPFSPAFNPQLLDANVANNAHAAIGSMNAGGWTGIIRGYSEADTQLNSIVGPFPRQAIVVFSDGKHNRPAGSTLSSIKPSVLAANYRFYSIGFGTDVDDDILSDIAGASGGIHVNEQDLSALQLTKYFLTVGALAHNMAVLADPTYELEAGDTGALSVELSELDQSVTFAVNWTGVFAKDVHLILQGPDERCKIRLANHKGLEIKKGRNYRLIRVDLPYDCKGTMMHEGTWKIVARPEKIAGDAKETFDIMILGDSRLRLDAEIGLAKEGSLLLVAGFELDGKFLPDLRAAQMMAEVLLPLPSSGDSEKQDAYVKGNKPFPQEPRNRDRRLMKLELRDNGKDGDVTAGDGLYTAALDVNDLKPGLLQARFVGECQPDIAKLTRETRASFYVKGRQ